MKKSMNNSLNKLVFSLLLIIFLACLGGPLMLLSAQNTSTVTVDVGVVVDYHSWIGKMGLSCINTALSDLYTSNANYNTRLVLHFRDSMSDVVGAAAAALDLIKVVEVQALIIGSVTSMQANFVLELGHKAQVPIISYSTADPSLNLRSSYFFQATQSEASQVKALSAIVRAFRWKEVVPIYADNVYGEGLIPFLTDALLEVDAIVPYRSVIPSFATDHQLVAELQKLMTMQTRVFIVHMDVSLGARIFKKANEIGMMSEGYVWIVTNVITSFLGSIESSVIDSMQGVIGIKTYVPESKAFKRLQFQQDYNQITTNNSFKLNVFGLWAYDAATALAMAVEDVWNSGGFGFNKATTHVLSSNSTDLETFGVSLNGPRLLKALSNIRFEGLAGEFSLINGQLQPSTYQIINVLGNGQRVVGFWTPQNGLKRNLSIIKTSMGYSTNKHDLGPIIWPGDSINTPKGWEISPKNSRKLRIGVPQRANFKEFVNVQYDPSTNRTIVSGYCIEVFEALVEDLPYSFAYEFIPFVGRYEELVYQVYLGTFDGAVGDISITANRSLYVDFTFPYSESGASIVMPVKIRNNKNTWIFLKPWTWDLWAISACFFVFTGFVVWVLEHPINEDFQGPPSNQIGTSLWFSFSSLVFAHRERVVSNLARFVVVIWIFVVLILSQSYAASLTSFLTVQQLQPIDTNSILIELLQKGKNVGCQSTIICKLLTKQGFADSQIKVYKSAEVAYKLISHGDVAALLDETPYNNLFLAKYCSNFTLVGPIFRTDGFGFVFPKGWRLLSDFSVALMNAMEGEAMKQLERKWLGKQSGTKCLDLNAQVSSSLSPESFWGLFLIAGISSLSALLIHVAIFFYGQRHIILRSPASTEASTYDRILLVFKIFGQKYSKSPHGTSEKSTQVLSTDHRGGTNNVNVHGIVPIDEAIANSSSPRQSPSSGAYSEHRDPSIYRV